MEKLFLVVLGLSTKLLRRRDVIITQLRDLLPPIGYFIVKIYVIIHV